MRAPSTVHGGHTLALLEGARDWFPALIRALDTAQTQVQIETYILDVTGTGESVLQALERTALRGVRVQAASVVAISGTVTGAASCRVEVTSAQTISLGLGIWLYDLEATLTSGYVATLQQGTITIRRDVR